MVHFRLRLIDLGMSVFYSTFKKYADRIDTRYAAELCGNRPRLYIRIKSDVRVTTCHWCPKHT